MYGILKTLYNIQHGVKLVEELERNILCLLFALDGL